MRARGLTRSQAVHVYQVFTSFLLGSLMLETATMAQTMVEGPPLDEGDGDPHDVSTDAGPGPGPGERAHPTIEDLQPLLRDHRPDVEFDAALEALLDRLEQELPRLRSQD